MVVLVEGTKYNELYRLTSTINCTNEKLFHGSQTKFNSLKEEMDVIKTAQTKFIP